MSSNFYILIVDDSKAIVHYLIDILDDKHHNLLFTFSKDEAKKIICQNNIDIMICDLMLPELIDGVETVKYFKEINPTSKVLGISAHPDVANIVKIVKAGADDFVPKTSTKDQILLKIDLLKAQLKNHNGHRNKTIKRGDEDILIWQSTEMQRIFEKIKVIAENQVETCLLLGESGTGKDLVAKTIRDMSPRKKEPFVALNCAGMPYNLIDSELFGYERGSFTGAYNSNAGKFELAHRGILFLDEISEMPIHLQGKLLRVLESREITRIGGKKNIPVDVMIFAASNRDLEQEIRHNNFREDIYFRLNLVKIEIPPLRNRRADIPLLTKFFKKNIEKKLQKEIEITDGAIHLLEKYNFPGNVRELKNILYSAALFCKDHCICEKFLNQYLLKDGENGKKIVTSPNKCLKYSKEMIVESLKAHDGNITETAKDLGYTREGLSRKLKRLKINRDDYQIVAE